MFSLNKVQLIGNLGNPADVKVLTSGTKLATFSVATTNSYKDKDGNWVNETEWTNVTAFGVSDYIIERLGKGAKVYVEGRLTTDEYKDKDGNDRRATKVIANRFGGIILLSEAENTNAEVDDVTEVSDNPDDDLPF